MPELKGQDSEISMKINVTRAATGKVEEYTLTATVTPEQLKQLKENENGSNTLSSVTSSSD